MRSFPPQQATPPNLTVADVIYKRGRSSDPVLPVRGDEHQRLLTPDFIVNCTVNVQDMCQKEVLVKPDGTYARGSGSEVAVYPACRQYVLTTSANQRHVITM
ncbi:hypothetical protein WMY93_022801 [Mugilogobius chulae]|uniref:Uncharacterized protein n=1 Tax=Mugilogobius chulae TaxID=88201 RepID=A0AAW0NDR2_9GOBI